MITRFRMLVLWAIFVSLVLWNLTPTGENSVQLEQPAYDLSKLSIVNQTKVSLGFNDLTLSAGIHTAHSQKSLTVTGIHESQGGGVCVFDINQDGWVDIVSMNGTGNTHYFGHPEWWQNRLSSVSVYLNNRDGGFEDITRKSGLLSKAVTMGCTVGDLDQDGDLDIVLLNRGVNELWENLGGSTFSLEGNPLAKFGDDWSTSATIADFNNDGLPDIYVGNYLRFQSNSNTFEGSAGLITEVGANFDPSLYSGVPNTLLINLGDSAFVDRTSTWDVSNSAGRTLSVFTDDINEDGRADILIANDEGSESKYFENIGIGFEDRSTELALASTHATTAILKTKFGKNIGNELLQISGTGESNRLLSLTNNTNVAPIDISPEWRLNNSQSTSNLGWSPAIADFNLDGWEDMFLVSGQRSPNADAKGVTQSQPSQLFINNYGEGFSESSKTKVPSTFIGSSRCAVAADFNNDGLPDILVATNNGLPRLLVNGGKASRWIGLDIPRLNSTLTDPTIVVIETTERRLEHRPRNGSRGQCWQTSSRLSLALRPNEEVKSISVDGHAIELNHKLMLNQYNWLIPETKQAGPLQAVTPRSEIRIANTSTRMKVTEWMLRNKQTKQAHNELKLLSTLPASNAQQLQALIGTLSREQQLTVIPGLMRSSSTEVVASGVALIRELEDDRLADDLFNAFEHRDPELACAAMETLTHFFAEEEAMVISKYAGLAPLIRVALGADPQRQVCALRALAESEKFKAQAVMFRALNNADPSVRGEAIIGLGRIREGEGVKTLLNHLNNKEETSRNIGLILKSIQKIEPRYDLAQLVNDQLISGRRANILESLALSITESNTNILDRPLVLKISDQLKLPSHSELSLSEEIDLLTLIKSDSQSSLSRLRLLAQSADRSVSARASKALLTLSDDPNVLQELLNSNQAAYTLLSTVNVQGLTLEEVKELAKSVKPAERKTAVGLLLEHAVPSGKLRILNFFAAKPTLFSNASSAKFLGLIRPGQDAKSCEMVWALLNPNLQVLLDENTAAAKQIDRLLSRCFEDEKIDDIPTNVRFSLSNTSFATPIALRFIGPRTELWARQQVNTILTSPKTSIENLITLIRSLSDSPPPSQTQTLQRFFESHSNWQVTLAAASKLAAQPEWIKNHSEVLASQIDHALDSQRYEKALNLGELLFSVAPNDTLALFVENTE